LEAWGHCQQPLKYCPWLGKKTHAITQWGSISITLRRKDRRLLASLRGCNSNKDSMFWIQLVPFIDLTITTIDRRKFACHLTVHSVIQTTLTSPAAQMHVREIDGVFLQTLHNLPRALCICRAERPRNPTARDKSTEDMRCGELVHHDHDRTFEVPPSKLPKTGRTGRLSLCN